MHFATVFGKRLSVTQCKRVHVKEEVYYLKINFGNPFHNILCRHFLVAKKDEKKCKTSEGKANNS